MTAACLASTGSGAGRKLQPVGTATGTTVGQRRSSYDCGSPSSRRTVSRFSIELRVSGWSLPTTRRRAARVARGGHGRCGGRRGSEGPRRGRRFDRLRAAGRRLTLTSDGWSPVVARLGAATSVLTRPRRGRRPSGHRWLGGRAWLPERAGRRPAGGYLRSVGVRRPDRIPGCLASWWRPPSWWRRPPSGAAGFGASGWWGFGWLPGPPVLPIRSGSPGPLPNRPPKDDSGGPGVQRRRCWLPGWARMGGGAVVQPRRRCACVGARVACGSWKAAGPTNGQVRGALFAGRWTAGFDDAHRPGTGHDPR